MQWLLENVNEIKSKAKLSLQKVMNHAIAVIYRVYFNTFPLLGNITETWPQSNFPFQLNTSYLLVLTHLMSQSRCWKLFTSRDGLLLPTGACFTFIHLHTLYYTWETPSATLAFYCWPVNSSYSCFPASFEFLIESKCWVIHCVYVSFF